MSSVVWSDLANFLEAQDKKRLVIILYMSFLSSFFIKNITLKSVYRRMGELIFLVPWERCARSLHTRLLICPKTNLGFGIEKTNVGIRISIQKIPWAPTLWQETTLTFSAQLCPKRNLELEIHKTNVGIRISTLKIPCVPIFRQNAQLWLAWPKFAQKRILGLEI